jgi:hypothetical protein
MIFCALTAPRLLMPKPIDLRPKVVDIGVFLLAIQGSFAFAPLVFLKVEDPQFVALSLLQSRPIQADIWELIRLKYLVKGGDF